MMAVCYHHFCKLRVCQVNIASGPVIQLLTARSLMRKPVSAL